MKNRRLLTDEQDAFLRSIAKGKSGRECAELLNKQFGTSFTYKQIQYYKKNHHILSGGQSWEYSIGKGLFTEEQLDYFMGIYKGRESKEVAEMMNSKFKTSFTAAQIHSYRQNHKLPSGFITRFKKGHASPNKGKKLSREMYLKASPTMFKKGNIPKNTVPVGTEKMISGFVWVKINNKIKAKKTENWVLKHRYIYEQHHGKIPDGHNVIFKDGNRTNFDIDNLALVSKSEMNIMNSRNLRSSNKELTESCIAVARLINATRKKKVKK